MDLGGGSQASHQWLSLRDSHFSEAVAMHWCGVMPGWNLKKALGQEQLQTQSVQRICCPNTSAIEVGGRSETSVSSSSSFLPSFGRVSLWHNILTQIIRTQLRLQEILYHVHTPIWSFTWRWIRLSCVNISCGAASRVSCSSSLSWDDSGGSYAWWGHAGPTMHCHSGCDSAFEVLWKLLPLSLPRATA